MVTMKRSPSDRTNEARSPSRSFFNKISVTPLPHQKTGTPQSLRPLLQYPAVDSKCATGVPERRGTRSRTMRRLRPVPRTQCARNVARAEPGSEHQQQNENRKHVSRPVVVLRQPHSAVVTTPCRSIPKILPFPGVSRRTAARMITARTRHCTK
jgi:hypothetical protein